MQCITFMLFCIWSSCMNRQVQHLFVLSTAACFVFLRSSAHPISCLKLTILSRSDACTASSLLAVADPLLAGTVRRTKTNFCVGRYNRSTGILCAF